MREEQLRTIALAWLQARYSLSKFALPLFKLHELHQTITEYLKSRLIGQDLTRIPLYDQLDLEPDIVGVVKLRRNNDYSLAWITAEVKVNEVNMTDFREALFFAEKTHSYDAFLLYDGRVTKDVARLVKKGGHSLQGVTKWGNPSRKFLSFLRHQDGRFVRNTSL